MKFWFRQVCITLTVLTVLAACGLAAFLWSFDPNSYKNALQVMVQQRLDRQLNIRGDLKVVLFPDIAIQAKEVSLSERGSENIFASVEDLRATIALLPLLSNHLVIQEISLTGLKAQVQRIELGNFVLEDLLGWGRTASQASVSSGGSADPGLLMNDTTIDIAEILIKKSELIVLDAKGQPSWKLQDASVEFGRIKRGEPFKAELTARIHHGDSPSVAKVNAQAVWSVDMASRAISAKNFSASFKGDLPENIWFEQALNKVDLSLSAPKLNIEPDHGRLSVERLAIRAKGMRERAAFEWSLDAPSLNISNDAAQGQSVNTRLRLDGSPAIDARIVLDGLQGNRNKLLFERSSVDLAIKQETRVLKVMVNGPLRIEPLNLALSISGFQGDVQTLQTPTPKTILSTPIRGSFSTTLDVKQSAALPLNISAQLDGVPFATLLSSFGIDSIVDGNAAIELKARLAPGAWSRVLETSVGTAQFRLRPASIQGFDLSSGLDALRVLASTDMQVASGAAEGVGRSQMDDFDLALKFDSGVAQITRLNMTAPGWNVKQGSPGQINLKNNTLDTMVWLQFLSPQTLTIKRATIQVRALRVPVTLTGDVLRPSLGIQWATIERNPVGRALKENLLNLPSESRSGGTPSAQGIQKK